MTPTDLDALRGEVATVLPCQWPYAAVMHSEKCRMCDLRPAVLAFLQRKLEEKDVETAQRWMELHDKADKAEARITQLECGIEGQDAALAAVTTELKAAREIGQKYEDRYFAAQTDLASAREEIVRLKGGR